MGRVLIFAVFVVATQNALASAPLSTREFLYEFHKNPQKIMNTPLQKLDTNGHLVDPNTLSPGLEGLEREEALKYRDNVRAEICAAAGMSCNASSDQMRPRAQADQKNKLSVLFPNETIQSNLAQIEALGLTKVMLKEPPWSDSYWPTNGGLIGKRFADPGFPNSNTWIDNYSYILGTPAASSTAINRLAPSEKYDLLVGDSNWSMTQANWQEGKYSYDRLGYVPSWFGLCHGWAPAAMVFKQPEREVTVTGVQGQRITFYPSDIKALASAIWGNAPTGIRFIGTRCKTNRPQQDEFGRVIEPGCFDVNPASWHLGIVNMVGIKQRSVVIDSTYDFQVWNYPVAGYHYTYFNPQTLEVSETIGGAATRVSDYTIDKFKKYRAPEARYVVGISMDLTYTIPTQATTKPSVKPTYHRVKYVYDLELAADGKVIGGEWYSNFHPDFFWNPAPEARALADVEKELSYPFTWDGRSPLPAEASQLAREASRKMQPLGAIVERLVELSLLPTE